MTGADAAPLQGLVVLDLSRMLPGAVLARQLLDLGARVLKVEDPVAGDPFRHTPPLVGNTGAGFVACYRGAESLGLDLRSPGGAAAVRRLAKGADVLVESFRPGTMARWGLGRERLAALNPGLVWCSLSGFGRAPGWAGRVGHDLNFTAMAGVLDLVPGGALPHILLADVAAGLLAASAVLAALLERHRSGVGSVVEQPLAAAPLPFLTWPWADRAAGGDSVAATLLSGRCPSYRLYACADGGRVAVAALEPKLWVGLVELLGLRHLAGAGLDLGPEGERAAREVAAAFAGAPAEHWLGAAAERGLPVTPVNDLDAARAEPYFRAAGLLEEATAPGGATVEVPGPWLPSLGRTPSRPAPRLGEHTAKVLEEFGIRGGE